MYQEDETDELPTFNITFEGDIIRRSSNSSDPSLANAHLARCSGLLTTSSPTKAIAVFTASHAKPAMKEMVHRLSGLDQEEGERRIIMVGCEDVPGFEAVALGNAVDILLVEKGVVQLAKKTLLQHPNICAFLFECTELPPFSAAVRRATRLPVWDAITRV